MNCPLKKKIIRETKRKKADKELFHCVFLLRITFEFCMLNLFPYRKHVTIKFKKLR
jgi:hypothetical protein